MLEEFEDDLSPPPFRKLFNLTSEIYYLIFRFFPAGLVLYVLNVFDSDPERIESNIIFDLQQPGGWETCVENAFYFNLFAFLVAGFLIILTGRLFFSLYLTRSVFKQAKAKYILVWSLAESLVYFMLGLYLAMYGTGPCDWDYHYQRDEEIRRERYLNP